MSVVLSALVSTSAQAAPPSLLKAKQAYDDLEYDRVLPLLQRALKESPSTGDAVAIFELMANVHVMYDRPDDARVAFIELLKRAPEYQAPPSTAPKVRQAFEAAVTQVRVGTSSPAPASTAPGAGPTQRPTSLLTSEDTSPWYKHWWVWTAAGVGLVVVVGGSYAAWSLSQPKVPKTDFGPFPL